ncbi:hypothetical protein C7S10_07515 [Nocardioides currus]|uniref:Uncharacterized protein n=1 Tax=Nocardioides currus TaxID=2133958 RepID=A0A2R7Z169_9ACTN|nr:hypothetical protein C7S10_07515 [Nocardioides currus]
MSPMAETTVSGSATRDASLRTGLVLVPSRKARPASISRSVRVSAAKPVAGRTRARKKAASPPSRLNAENARRPASPVTAKS